MLGDDLCGESLLRYNWQVTNGPANGQAQFLDNGTNSAKNTTAVFSQPGKYTIACTITNGLFGIVSSVEVMVEEVAGRLAA